MQAMQIDPALAGGASPPSGDQLNLDDEEIQAAADAAAAAAAASSEPSPVIPDAGAMVLATPDDPSVQAGDDADVVGAGEVNGETGDGTPAKGGKRYPDGTPKLARSKIAQCVQLRHASEQVLAIIWRMMEEPGNLQGVEPQFTISRALDRLFGELHALANQYKAEHKAMIWPHEIPLKSIRENFLSGPGHAQFAVKKANIAIMAEHVLYAMPEEDQYGRNDIVYACEGLLPLIPDSGALVEEETWRLFNELKMQIYIQRLETMGKDETDSKVLPNLFVESLGSYSGQDVPPEVDAEFDKLGQQTHAEIIVASGNLEKLKQDHPYNRFALWAFQYLNKCYMSVETAQKAWEAEHPDEEDKPKRPKNKKKRDKAKGLAGLVDQGDASYGQEQVVDHQVVTDIVNGREGDIAVQPDQLDEYEEPQRPRTITTKNRFNPYKLGRGKGSTTVPRRRWTPDELELLLDEVRLHANKYDCMAQIIKRHGKNGEVSTILSEQNNVSLKDKARNLTMEWEKNGYPPDKPWVQEAFARFAVKHKPPKDAAQDEMDIGM